MKTTIRRPARLIYIWLKPPYSREDVDAVTRQLPGWHASNYPSVAGSPIEMAFFDHAKADAAVTAASQMPAVENASPVHQFELGRTYRVHGATPGDDCLYRCVARRGRFAEFVREDVHGNAVPASRVKKQLRQHAATNYLRGDYVELDRKRRIYAADDAAE
jgi:hypothetical protein